MRSADAVAGAMQVTATRLRAAGCLTADDEAALFVEAAPDPATLDRWIERREQGEPPAWIIGSVTFGGLSITVDHGVYVPRPHSEELAIRAASALRALPLEHRVAADLCTGSGAVAAYLQASVPDSVVVGVDVDARAVHCARRNGVPTVRGNLGDPLGSGVFGVVTAVVPYVPTDRLQFLPPDVVDHEPTAALDGGPDGLTVARCVVASAGRLLRRDGHLFLELGGDQFELLTPHLANNGFGHLEPWFDYDGDLRGVSARSCGGQPRSRL